MDLRLKYPLHDLVRGAISGDYTHSELAELHKLVYVIGRRYIRRRCANGGIPVSLIGLEETDIVHDCIAELFLRSDSGELTEFARYFDYRRLSVDSLPEDALLLHLRTLVFTVAGDNIFRMLNEADPALGTIIRNLKLAAGKSERWSIETRFEEKLLVLRDGRPAGGAREAGQAAQHPIDEEALASGVCSVLARHSEIPALMRVLADVLEESGVRSGAVPLITMAVMVKKGFEMARPEVDAGEPGDDVVIGENLADLVHECCGSVGAALRPKYVGGGKVGAEVFDGYMTALKRAFNEDHALNPGSRPAGPEGTYLEFLRSVLPQVTKEQYLIVHRPVFEYLARLVRQCLRKKLGGA